jgi:uncharacterized peroxidase-related enzyme
MTMTRIDPVAPPPSPAFDALQTLCMGTLGFVPNSVLNMLRVPGLAQALGAMNQAVMDQGRVDAGFKRLVAHMASRAAGCSYCMAHTAAGARLKGVDADQLDALWEYQRSPCFTPAQRTALDFALAAGQVPNAVDDALFTRMRQHWSDDEVLEITGVVALFGFLNRWNDTLATPLEHHPMDTAQQHLAGHGWSSGKHAR